LNSIFLKILPSYGKISTIYERKVLPTVTGQEIDVIIEARSGSIVGIEIKLTTTPSLADRITICYQEK
jgi:hypothetical protein